MALVDLLQKNNFHLKIVHVNHGLRSEAIQDEDFVRNYCKQKDLAIEVCRGDVAKFAKDEGLTIEEAARIFRYTCFSRIVENEKFDFIAVAHTADDQAETIMMNFLRGSGLAGLSAMDYCSFSPLINPKIPLIRPLLGFWRKEIETYCKEENIQFITDASNFDEKFFRNKIRHSILPYLEQESPGLRKRLWQMADILKNEDQVIQEVDYEALDEGILYFDGEIIQFSRSAFLDKNIGLKRRLLINILKKINPSFSDLTYSLVERAIHFLETNTTGIIDLVNNYLLEATEGFFVIFHKQVNWTEKIFPQLRMNEIHELRFTDEVWLEEGSWKFTTALINAENINSFTTEKMHAYINPDLLRNSVLTIRSRKKGDRFQPFGMVQGSMLLSDFMINEKIPSKARDHWPLVSDLHGNILWVPGYRTAQQTAVRSESKQVLSIRLEKVS